MFTNESVNNTKQLLDRLQTAIKDLWIQFEDELATSLTELAKTLLDNYLKEVTC